MRVIKTAIMAAMESEEIGQKCTPLSIYRSVVQASLMGLTVGSGFNEGYFIRYKDACTFRASYLGWAKVAQRSEGVDLIQVVLEKQAWYDPAESGPGPMSDSPLREPGAPKLVPAFKHNFRQVLLSCRRPELYGPISTYERSAFGHHPREVGPLIMEQFNGYNP